MYKNILILYNSIIYIPYKLFIFYTISHNSTYRTRIIVTYMVVTILHFSLSAEERLPTTIEKEWTSRETAKEIQFLLFLFSSSGTDNFCPCVFVCTSVLARRALFVIQGSYSHYSGSLAVLFRKHAPTCAV